MSSSLWLDVIRTHDRLLSGEIDGPRISVGAITVWTHPSNKPPPLPPASRNMREYRFELGADDYAALQLIVQLRRQTTGDAYDPAGVLQKWLEEYVLTKECGCDLSAEAINRTRLRLRQFSDELPEFASLRGEAAAATVQARLTAQQDYLLAKRLDHIATEEGLRVTFEEFLAAAVSQKAVSEIEDAYGSRQLR